MEKGKIINTTAVGLKPVIIRQNINKIEAIELREAKNPFVVENSPTNARVSTGILISGARKTLSSLLCHEKTGDNPEKILLK